MTRRVLIATFETPGYGGASTASYALFAQLQRDGFDVHFLSLVDSGQEHFLHSTFGPAYANPEQLSDVHTTVLEGAFHRAQPELSRRLRALAPGVVVAVGYIAALAIKQAAPELRLVLFTSGSAAMERYLTHYGDAAGVLAALRTGAADPAPPHLHEQRAVELADLILVHAPLVREVFELVYPYHVGKVYPEVIWMAEWVHLEASKHSSLARPFAERDIDLLFVASRWDRPVKNLPLARAIIDGCPALESHMVGLLPQPLARGVSHGIVPDRTALFDLMGRSRCIVSPSRWDAAPQILFEGAALGCNLVASRNCGNWMTCHPELVVDHFTAADYIEVAGRAAAREYANRMEQVLGQRSYRTLADICMVF